MLNALAPVLLAVAMVLGCVIPTDRDPRRGRQVPVMIAICLVCAALGAVGEIA